MKKLLLLLVLAGIFSRAHSQELYGNEWINYSQSYYKFRIIQDGLYRIPTATLQNFGLPINSINGSNIQIFGGGKELPIYVTTSGILGPNDYVEFYAVHNDGYWDSTLYADHTWQSNDKLSLYTDSAYYFLTWSSSPSLNHFANATNNINNPPPAEPFCWYTTTFTGTRWSFCRGAVALTGEWLWDSDFSNTEGWMDVLQSKASRDFNVSTPHVYSPGPNARLKTQILGYGHGPEASGNYDHYMVINVNNNLLWNGHYVGFSMQRLTFDTIPVSWLTSPTTALQYTTAASPSDFDYNAVNNFDFKYPREFDFDNASSFMFGLNTNGSNQYLTIGNFDEAATTPILYDFTDKIRMTAVVQNDSEKFLLPPSLVSERQFLLIANDTPIIRTVDSLFSVHFVDYSLPANQGNFLIITHPNLMIDSFNNHWIDDYKSMKNSHGYHSVIVNINELYDEFAYGIRFHPAAIRKFSHFVYDTWQPQEKRYMFLVGKGIELNWLWSVPSLGKICFVPTFGIPGSDCLLTARGFSPTPLIPVGRLPVLSAEEIKPYLDKVALFVAAQDTVSDPHTFAHSGWMKNVMHLVGGASAADQAYFSGILKTYEDIIEGPYYGANVYTFKKDNSLPIQLATNALIDSLLKSGVSLITFFGHSSYTSLDFNLDKPQDYDNYGRYPLLLTNGCLIGNLFDAAHGMADNFVLADKCGAIGFIGPSVFGIASSLANYSDKFYKNLTYGHYNQPIGDIMQQSVTDDQTGFDGDRATSEEMNLCGDPSLKLNTHRLPDYDLESQYVSFDPPTVTAGVDSFYIQMVIYNIGEAVNDSIYVDIKRTKPGSAEEFLYHKKIKAPNYNDTLRFVIQTDASHAFGLNQFYIKIDAGTDSSMNGDIDELSESNNTLHETLLINSDDILPVWPYNYSIVSAQGVTLKASTVNAFAAPQHYVIQIDTTQLFNSPLLQTKKIVQGGGVIHWTPTLTMQDSVVYYWRTSIDSLNGFDFSWHNSSFVYLPGSSPGWNQSHYFQFLSTIEPLGNIELPESRIFKYADDIKTLGVYNGMTWWVGGDLPYDVPAFYLNGARLGKWDCAGCGSTIQFAVIDAETGVFWQNESAATNCAPKKYGSIECHGNAQNIDHRPYFFYGTNAANPVFYPSTDSMVVFLRDIIPDGDYILIMSMNDMYSYTWDSYDSAVMNAFTDLGLSQIENINSTLPYVAFFKKNDPGYPMTEIVGDTFNSIIDTNFHFVGEWNTGYIESPLIGPAASWTSLHWKAHSIEPGSDDVSLQLIGINSAGGEVILSNNVIHPDSDLTGIDAAQYPYLKLRLNCTDTTYRTPIQLDYWRINYQPVPEAALNPALYLSLNDTVNQFIPMKLSVAVENLTPWDMDSILDKYDITDATNVLHSYEKRYQKLPGNGSINLDYTFETNCNCYAGTDYLYVEVNPDEDQPEQYHFNNIGILSYDVISDDLNPILDVTFDGTHIMDGDLVSAKPEIDIMLKDENKFVPMNDTSEFKIYFIFPDGSSHSVVFDNVTAFFHPADTTDLAKENTARVQLKEQFPMDGKYQLTVQGYDRSGNASGDNAYRISFEVINKPMISNVLNYPNPFTTSTRFVFTLTGYETPQQMKVTIYTISGKVVREIFLGQLGNVHVGNNISEYSFDGTDQYGDKLANGIYFYRVEAVLNGKNMDHYDNGTDQYFKKGIGKMYLMR